MLFTGTVAAQNQNITADGKTEERPMTQAELEAKYQELQTKISEMELQSSEFQKKIELETGINIPKRRYINLSYVDQRVKFGAEDGMKSDYGAAFEWGRTFFFNGKRPVAGLIRFGLDWSWVDLQYAAYTVDDPGENDNPDKQTAHFANLGMQLGPSITVTPIKNLNVKIYGHYAPSAAGFSPDSFDDFKLGYVGYMTGGLHLSYRFITLGVELRRGTAKFSSFNTGEHEDFEDDFVGPKVRTELPGTRFTLGFRF